MLTLINQTSALSSFRLEQQYHLLRQQCPELKSLEAQELFWIELEGTLNSDELKILQNIFPDAKNENISSYQLQFIIAPRQGTISPWSSKATDILHLCGLEKIVRIERGLLYKFSLDSKADLSPDQELKLGSLLADQMLETVFTSIEQGAGLFLAQDPKPLVTIPVLNDGRTALEKANQDMGLALSSSELDYLLALYQSLERNPTDTELMMFGVVNSEHCRHKIFNATWVLDHQEQEHSLFQMIKNTYKHHPQGVILAYKDNSAILEGGVGSRFIRDPESHSYSYIQEPCHWVIKVETHNHPTAISPFPGAATGSGGEIRDEGATGTGSWPKAGLTGYSVSHLWIPDFIQSWEVHAEKPYHMASALEIMISAPIGAASFNNEFGRPNLCGYFRSFGFQDKPFDWGYHKPIMIAGGLGGIRPQHLKKKSLPVGAQIIVLGGPAMRIGLGGGSASSMASGSSQAELDFASVQRGNPEMQRRCQEVISHCIALGEKNPILSIHDVGAGGLSNAIPELVDACERGAKIELRTIPSAETDLSPMELWCNEAQERYVLAIAEEDVELFKACCERERCLFEIIGEVTEDPTLIVSDGLFDNNPVNLSLTALFGDPPKLRREVHHHFREKESEQLQNISLKEAVYQVLKHPTVASKKFLITIGDRSVGGLTARDQMVGPWQVPVADCAVTCRDYFGFTGEAMSMGERAPVAILNPAASARLAVSEAITNLIASDVESLTDIKLSANWMAACGESSQDAALFDAVKTVGMELCPALGISIPVGKDSLSMQTRWQEDHEAKRVVSPLSLIMSAFANVNDVRQTLSPELQKVSAETDIILIDLGKGHQRLGGSVFLETTKQIGSATPDLDAPETLKNFFAAMKVLKSKNLVLAYHDRSDGGLLATLCEMMFASRLGISILLDDLGPKIFTSLFNEELGAVIQVAHQHLAEIRQIFHDCGLGRYIHVLGTVNHSDTLEIFHQGQSVLKENREDLEYAWSQVSYHIQKLRDHAECASSELNLITDKKHTGLFAKLTFDPQLLSPSVSPKRPRVAILREQGVNGHVEMAAAFDRAGFESVDVHMQDILSGQEDLTSFQGLAACGGFSYGDVLGAGRGWAKSILHHPQALESFKRFFENPKTFTLGVCNGCQMLSQLKSIIPGADHWPAFVRNQSEQFEARLIMAKVLPSPSLFFQDMEGSELPIVVSHGEGQTEWSSAADAQAVVRDKLAAMCYIDSQSQLTEQYPLNPNGSAQGQTAFTSRDGRALILMPHPERIFRTVQLSWHPKEWGEYSPWFKMFLNARKWVG